MLNFILATTYLPKNFEYIKLRVLLSQHKIFKKFDYLNYTAHPFENKKIKFPFKSFLSLEILSGDLFYNPFYYEKASKINSKLFSKKSNIIITIREPKSFVTSVYSELLSNIFTIKQKDYFVTQKNILKKKINIFLIIKNYLMKS